MSGCTTTRKLSLTDMSKEVVELPFKIDKLTITDSRIYLQPMNWRLPMIATKQQNWKGNPHLSEQNKSDIEYILRNSEKKDGIPVDMEFKILEGVCEIQGDWKSVKEYAKFKGELIIEIPDSNYKYNSYAILGSNKFSKYKTFCLTK